MFLTYLLRRMGQLVLLVLFVMFVVCVVLRLVPGDPVDIMTFGKGAITEEQKDVLRARLGLKDPLLVQFWRYLWNAFRGDLGDSFRFGTGAWDLVSEMLPATFELSIFAMFLASIFSISLGAVTALHKDSIIDHAGSILSVVGISVPNFFLGIILILLLSVKFRIFPTSGRGESIVTSVLAILQHGDLNPLVDSLRHLFLPAVTLALWVGAGIAKMFRSAILDVVGAEYVRVARAKGLTERMVIIRHVLRNALIPTVTIMGLQLGYILGGAFVVENVFGWPGIGRLAVQSVSWRDYPVIQAVVLVASTFFLLINLVVDMVYRYLDPRITFEER